MMPDFVATVQAVEEHDGYRLVDIKSDAMTAPLRLLITNCAGSCTRHYSIDEHHPEYARVKAALESGDRTVLFCYHTDLPPLAAPLPSA